MIEKLYIKQRIFSDEMIQEIRSEGDPIMLSGIHRNGKSLLDDKTRSSTHIKMPPEEWPDIVHPMFELMCQFDPSVNPQQFRCSENLEYLKYDLTDLQLFCSLGASEGIGEHTDPCNVLIICLDGDAWEDAQQLYRKLDGGKLNHRIRVIKMPTDADVAELGGIEDLEPMTLL